MSQLTGIAVTLKTASDVDAGTDDHLYIGVVGTGGGREFPLASPQEDFIQGEEEKFALGSIWEGGFVDGTTKFPDQSEPGGDNDPRLVLLDMDKVNFVYLRKQGGVTHDGDDEYKLQLLRVVLYGPNSPDRRAFFYNNLTGRHSVWLANEKGLVIYLEESQENIPS
jgi:hypothetical protein